ncbi:MAG: hypothetical protein PHQ36_04165 [Anaerolineales bacterium]|nr:hypothetical protein [Anaerolineales bacterium]
MMREDALLQQAITAARAGHELTARDMFLRVVEAEPKNEIAWMWLAGLLDNLDERIYACEQIMGINPRNAKAQTYLSQLLTEKQNFLDIENIRVEDQLRGIRAALKSGKKNSALQSIRELILNPQAERHPDVWRWLADLSPELNERASALEKLSALNPNDLRVQEELKQARHFQEHPIHQAELYEERGEIDKALLTYRMVALNPESKAQWNKIYWKIIELENIKQENIAHISPALSIARLTAGPPLVYVMFALVHVGVNPFAHQDPLIWLGLVFVTLGGFMIALAAVHSHNRLWTLLFKDAGAKGAPTARLFMSIAGWALTLIPHIMLFVLAWRRLINYALSLQ